MITLLQLAFTAALSLSVTLNSDRATVLNLWLKTLNISINTNISRSIQQDIRLYGSDNYLVLDCKTCAYVASSGYLNGKGNGKEIEDHDCIVRPNVNPVYGFEKDVGWRTTIRMVSGEAFGIAWKRMTTQRIYGEPDFDPSLSNRTIFIQYDEFSNSDRDKALEIFPLLRLFEISPKRIDRIIETLRKVSGNSSTVSISADIWSINLMFDFCGSIDVFGLSDGRICDSVKEEVRQDLSQYYFKGEPKECNSNGTQLTSLVAEELEFYNYLLNGTYNINFHDPNWK